MSPTDTLLAVIATAAIAYWLGIGTHTLVTWDRQVGIARAEYRMNAAEQRSEQMLRDVLTIAAAAELPAADPHVTGELEAIRVEPEPHALSDEPEHDDEDAPAEDTDRPGLWLVLAAIPAALWQRVCDVFRSLGASRRERHLIGSGEQATANDPFAELLAHVEQQPEPVTIVHRDHRYRKPGDTGLYPLVKVIGDKAAGRHRADVVIPEQRTGGDRDEQAARFCGHTYIGNAGEFTCRLYANHDGRHWDYFAEVGWTDDTTDSQES